QVLGGRHALEERRLNRHAVHEPLHGARPLEDVVSEHGRRPAVVEEERREQAHERRLPRAVLPQDRDALAPPERERHVVESGHAPAAPAVAHTAVAVTADELLAQIADFDSRLGGHDCSMPREGPGRRTRGRGPGRTSIGARAAGYGANAFSAPAQQVTLSSRHPGLKSAAAAYHATRCWRSLRGRPSRDCGSRTSPSRITA